MPTHLKELASLGGVVKCRRRNGQQQWRAHMKSLDGYGPRRLRKEDASGDLTRMRAAPTRADVSRVVAELPAEAIAAMIQSAKDDLDLSPSDEEVKPAASVRVGAQTRTSKAGRNRERLRLKTEEDRRMHEAAAAVGSSTLSSLSPLVSQDTPLAGNTSTCISWQRQGEEVRHKTNIVKVVGRNDDELDERWLQDGLNVGEYDDISDEAIFAGHAPIAHTNTMIQEQGTNQSQPPDGERGQGCRRTGGAGEVQCGKSPMCVTSVRPADSRAAKSVQDGSFGTFCAERKFARGGFP